MYAFYSQTCVRKFEKMKTHTSLQLGAGTELDKSCVFQAVKHPLLPAYF